MSPEVVGRRWRRRAASRDENCILVRVRDKNGATMPGIPIQLVAGHLVVTDKQDPEEARRIHATDLIQESVGLDNALPFKKSEPSLDGTALAGLSAENMANPEVLDISWTNVQGIVLLRLPPTFTPARIDSWHEQNLAPSACLPLVGVFEPMVDLAGRRNDADSSLQLVAVEKLLPKRTAEIVPMRFDEAPLVEFVGDMPPPTREEQLRASNAQAPPTTRPGDLPFQIEHQGEDVILKIGDERIVVGPDTPVQFSRSNGTLVASGGDGTVSIDLASRTTRRITEATDGDG